MLEDVEKRVDKGIAILDKYGPECWKDKINVDILDVGDGQNCVLGQIYGGYSTGIQSLFLRVQADTEWSEQIARFRMGEWATEHAFYSKAVINDSYFLNRVWGAKLTNQPIHDLGITLRKMSPGAEFKALRAQITAYMDELPALV